MKTTMRNLIFILSWLPYCLWGQTGTVTGVVLDNAGPLPGATVTIKGTTIGTATDFDGKFTITDLNIGTDTLVVAFLGYDDKLKAVEIKENELMNVGKINLEESAAVMEEVVVKATMKNGEAKAINMIKNSDRLVNVVAAKGIGKLPDKNAAEALQRVPAISIERDHGEGRYVSVRGTPRDWSASLINNDRMPVADEDGNSRTLSFDIFPSELIEYIVVSKSLTPDIEADAIGGSINFMTRTAPEERILNAKLGGGANFQSQTPIVDASLLYGDRLLKGKLGYLLSASIYNRGWGTDNYEVVYGSNFNHGVNRLELRDYTGRRNTMGFNASVEYKFSDYAKIYAKGVHGRQDDNECNRKVMFRYATGTGATVELQNIHSIMQMRFWGGEVGGQFEFGAKKQFKLNARVATYSNGFGYGPVPYEQGDSRNGYHVVRFSKSNVTYLDEVYDPNSSLRLKLLGDDQIGMQHYQYIEHPIFGTLEMPNADSIAGTGDHYQNIQPQIKDGVTADDFDFQEAYSELNQAYERDPIVGQLDFDYKISNKWKLKAGAKVRLKNGARRRGIHTWTQDISGSSTSNSWALPSFETEFLNTNGGFLEEMGSPYNQWMTSVPFLTTDAIDNFVENRENELIENEEITIELRRASAGGSFSYSENVIAGYAMGSFKLNKKFSVIGGIRLEHTALSMQADTILQSLDSLTGQVQLDIAQVGANIEYLDYFPSLHLRYSPIKALNLRLSASRSMRRPNFNETKPGAGAWKYTNQVIEYGNPNLKPSYAWNVDLAAEYFFKRVGLVSVSAFYKNIQNHIFATNNPLLKQQIGTLVGTIVRSYANADDAFVVGVELAINRKFNFLPGAWAGLGINANYTYIKSGMQVPGRDNTQPLPRQADHLLNVALFYEKYGLTARLALNYKGPFLMELNTYPEDATNPDNNRLLHQDTEYDIFMDEFMSLDASVSYKINKFLTVYAEANNLLNSPYRIYRGVRSRPIKTEYYAIRAQLGLKFHLN